MRLIDKKELVKITAEYQPDIKTIKQVMHETGRKRQQIERNKKLKFGIVLSDEDSGDIGVKVIIDDDALKRFIRLCKKRDKSGKERPAYGKAKTGKSLDDFINEF